ncbi:hypothetical protein VPH35_074475 [Triticum aestivum]
MLPCRLGAARPPPLPSRSGQRLVLLGGDYTFLPGGGALPLSCVSPSGCALRPLPRINRSGNREMKLQSSMIRKKRVSTLDI